MESVDTVFFGHEMKMIVNNTIKQLLLDKIYDITSVRVLDKLHESPGSFTDEFYKHPVFLTVNFKSDKYWLFFTTIEDVHCSVLVSRYVRVGYPYPRMFDVSASIRSKDAKFYENTLLECELIGAKDAITSMCSASAPSLSSSSPPPPILLYAADMMIQINRDVRKMNPCVRFANMHSILKQIELDVRFKLKPKILIHKCNIRHLRWYVRRETHEVYGLTIYSCAPNVTTRRVWIDKTQELYSKF